MDTIDRSLSEEQRMMRASCRAFVNDFVTPYIRQNWQREWLMDPDARLPRAILEQADKIGIRTLGVPEEFGGVPLDPAHEVQTFALISEEIARGDSGLSDKLVQIWKVSVLLRNVAPRRLQEHWFPRIVKDPGFLLAHCLPEPRGTPGLTIARCNETLGGRFMNNGELVFEDMRLPKDHLLVENDALQKTGVYFKPGKIIQASKNLGVGVAAFERTAEYVQNYVQGGRTLIKHQAVALRLAEMATSLRAVRALLNEAARAVDERAPDAEELCNMVKLFASQEVFKVAQHAVELHGGNGIMLDFGIEKLFRDAAVFLHMDATVDISKFKIVKLMFPHTAGAYAGPET